MNITSQAGVLGSCADVQRIESHSSPVCFIIACNRKYASKVIVSIRVLHYYEQRPLLLICRFYAEFIGHKLLT